MDGKGQDTESINSKTTFYRVGLVDESEEHMKI